MEKLQDSSYNSGIMTSFKGLLLFSLSVLSDSLWPHGLQHSRLPCSWPFPRACAKLMSIELEMSSNHLILCHPVSSCPQTCPASGSFPNNWLFASGGQTIRASASVSVLSMDIQDWFPLGLTDLISLWSTGLSRVFSGVAVWRHQFFSDQSFLLSSSHIHTWWLKKA